MRFWRPESIHYVALLVVIILFLAIHEGTHVIAARLVGTPLTYKIHVYGVEKRFTTPMYEGVKLAFIYGLSSIVTILLGYIGFVQRRRLAKLRNRFIGVCGFWFIICFMILDPLNLSVGGLIYEGDALGIAIGLGINRHLVEATYFTIFIINMTLIMRKLLPTYKTEVKRLRKA